MEQSWTSERILALAPDPAAARAGGDLAAPGRWTALGRAEEAVWGECRGSAAAPYHTALDLGEPAYRCTCPSRKFPCKHALGLFLLLEAQPRLFPASAPPGWAADWLEARSRRRPAPETEPRGPDATQRRAAEREAKVAAGVAELRLWLDDLVRGGLAGLERRPASFWQDAAARMIDAQAPGLARTLRRLSALPGASAEWPEHLLEGLAGLFLVLEGFRRLADLPGPLAADLRGAIGWTQSQEALLAAAPHVRDRWLALGQCIEEDDGLRTRRLWLQGQSGGADALLLSHAHGRLPADAEVAPGQVIDADLVFYPSAAPARALIALRHATPAPPEKPARYAGVPEAFGRYAAALAGCPWLEQQPMALAAVVPIRHEATWALRDLEGRLVPLAVGFDRPWLLLSLSGGHPIEVFGEWDGVGLRPLSALAEGRFHAF